MTTPGNVHQCSPYYSDGSAIIYRGDALDVLPRLEPGTVDCVITSPPYAMQRQAQYGGVLEFEYPTWTTHWVTRAAELCPTGSIFINIREHVEDGQLSDYVHRTRLAVRDAGLYEIDELIWLKPDPPPVGHPYRPRRSWERILWFSAIRQPTVYPQANGRWSHRIGGYGMSKPSEAWRSEIQNPLRDGQARCTDVVTLSVGSDSSIAHDHAAVFPIGLPKWLINLATLPGQTVLDPFVGTGTTLRAAKDLGRHSIGIELDPAYCDIAVRKLAQEVMTFE